MNAPPLHPYNDLGMRLLVAASAIGFAVALFNFFAHGNGIHGTAGALLVVISTFLLAAAGAALIAVAMAGWLRGTLVALIGLGVIGTAIAAYMLEANILLGLMGFGFIGWIGHLIAPAVPLLSHLDTASR